MFLSNLSQFALWLAGRRMFLVHNEQTKLTAGWLNALATALVAAGVFAPAAAFFYQLTPAAVGGRYIALAFACFALGGTLHLLGRVFLRRLRE